MADRVTVPILRENRFVYGDEVGIELASVVQPDYLRIWTTARRTMGFGHGEFGADRFGYTTGAGFGAGPFGLAVFGQGARAGLFKTSDSKRAGDYDVRTRARDAVGNVGSWGSTETVQHRPVPAAPKDLTLDADDDEICWEWDADNG